MSTLKNSRAFIVTFDRVNYWLLVWCVVCIFSLLCSDNFCISTSTFTLSKIIRVKRVLFAKRLGIVKICDTLHVSILFFS